MVTWFGFWIRVVISFILTGYSEFLCKNTNKDTSLLFKMSFTTLCAMIKKMYIKENYLISNNVSCIF